MVTVLARSPAVFLSACPEFADQDWLNFHAGDMLKPQSLPRAKAFSHILHAAADSTRGPQLTPLQRYDQIVDGTRNLLDLALHCGVQRFLLTSSGAVYGRQPADLALIPEDWNGIPDPLDPANAYGMAKRAAEHLCALYGQYHGLQIVVARCFAFVGPDLPLNVHFAIGNFIRDALWRDAITVSGDGRPIRSYLGQDDLAHWLSTLVERGEGGQAYNVGSDKALSINEVAHLVRDVIAPGKTVLVLGKADADSPRNRYLPDIRKATGELGLEVTIPLEQAIDRAAGVFIHRFNPEPVS